MSVPDGFMKETEDLIQFDLVRDHLSEEQKKEVDLVTSIINVDEKSTEEVCKVIDASGKDIYFIFNCIKYVTIIRPQKSKYLFSLLFKYVKKYKPLYKNFDLTLNNLLDLMRYEHINIYIGLYQNNKTIDDVFNVFPEGSIYRAIKDDNVDLFLNISSQLGFNKSRRTDIIRIPNIYYVKNESTTFAVSYLQLMAFYGAANCFKRAYLSGKFPDNDLSKYAIAGGNYEIIQLLKDKSPDYFDGCFNVSIRFHHYDISEWLLSNYKCEPVSQVECLCYYNFLGFHFFKLNGIDVLPSKFNEDIYKAIRNGNFPNVLYLIEKGDYDFNKKDETGQTPLYQAIESNSLQIVELLVKHGADVNIKDNNGVSPLHFASKKSNMQIVDCLIENGANIEEKDNSGKTPLFESINGKDFLTTKYLISRGANVNAKEENGNTPLFFAVINDDSVSITILIDSGANVNERNNKGQTPIFYALKEANLIALKLLINHGANVNAEDNDGKTPLQTSLDSKLKKDDPMCVQFLINNGGK